MRRLITIPLRRCSLPFASTIAGDKDVAWINGLPGISMALFGV
jgi:hypothetical protein